MFNNLKILDIFNLQKIKKLYFNKRKILNNVFNFFIKTTSNAKYIFKNIGLFFLKKIIKPHNKPYYFKYKIKKLLYSFFFNNDIKNRFFLKKQKIKYYNFIYLLKKKKYNKYNFSLINFKKKFNFYKNINIKLFNNNYINQNKLFFYKKNYENILFEFEYKSRGNDKSFIYNELRIKRIRFKPGYKKIWREAREALKIFFKKKFIYQQQLTKYLFKFNKNVQFYFFNKKEMTLKSILLYSKLLPDARIFNIFYKKKYIYINGYIVKSHEILIYQNDLLQLIISKWFYILNRWLTNWTILRLRKFKRLIFRKNIVRKYTLMKNKKKKSYYTPNWIFLNEYDISDIKSYLEVDYFSLTLIIIYDPFLISYFQESDFLSKRYNIYRLYNWKYIT